MLNNADDVQARANARYAAQVRAQQDQERRGRAARAAAEENRMKAVRAVQWRTRFRAVEKKLIEIRTYLLYNPKDPSLRREADELETMYWALLDEAG